MRRTLVIAIMMCFPSGHHAFAQQADLPIFFIADPQVHNVHGIALKQMIPIADKASKVAIRPPEVNLLAPLVLRHALETGHKANGDSSKLVVVLGDGTNIGCSGEADVFDDEFRRFPSMVRLIAHGNHDSYMMGTINSYGPVKSNVSEPTGMMKAELPVDEAWWSPKLEPESKKPKLRGRNWLDACYKPENLPHAAGTPMNKVRWLARYAKSLKRQGMVQRYVGRTDDGGFEYVETAEPLTALAKFKYRARGVWYRPQKDDNSPPVDYQRTWESFLVQAADVSDAHTLVLIDTSVCRDARGGIRMWGSNAGTHACIGARQFKVIGDLLRQIPRSRKLIFAAHFPLIKLEKAERKELRELMRKYSPEGWTFISGHTHDASSPYVDADGMDLNIGSTTDWPMESHVVRFKADSAQIAGVDSTLLGKTYLPLAYSLKWDLAGKYSELCRHLPAADKLAEANPEQYQSHWISPTVDKDSCNLLQKHWLDNAHELTRHMKTISRRFDDEPEYRRFILRLAAGASLYEFRNGRRTGGDIR